MLRIERLRIEINTENGDYGFDEEFSSGLNFLASDENTCGKSSIIEAVYYCLGFEEIIGGKGDKVLPSVFKNNIETDQGKLPVLESKIYLQISNGDESVTLLRTVREENRNTNLITIYYSELNKMDQCELIEDKYVHMSYSATNKNGFHYFLEKFMHMDLPDVPSYDDKQRKLYLQLIFSCLFIEQKHGWADIFSGMPNLGIKDAKKRVLEYIMNLDTLNNEKKIDDLKNKESKIKSEWSSLIKEIITVCEQQNCEAVGLQTKPQILSIVDLKGIHIVKNKININEYIKNIHTKLDECSDLKPKVKENFNALQKELDSTEQTINEYEQSYKTLKDNISKEKAVISVLNSNLEIINNDLRNNKDAARLRKLGSELNCLTAKDICPLCHQKINDSLFPVSSDERVMSIDDNIRHLQAQKTMFAFARESHKKNINDMEAKTQVLQGNIFSLRRLAKVIRSDLYSVDEEMSESLVYKKVALQAEADTLEKLNEFIEAKKNELVILSDNWKECLSDKGKLPNDKFTYIDYKKIKSLKDAFILNLKNYGYKSDTEWDDIDISQDTYLPVIKNFDMKFDSSASDNIRGIWAYTIALTEVSLTNGGNHPAILIFDEPVQHSIIPEAMEKFFESIVNLGSSCQTIIGITLKDSDTLKYINKLEEGTYKMIHVQNKAFKKMGA